MQLASVQMPTLKSLVLEQIYEEALKNLMVTSFQAQDVGGSLELGDEASSSFSTVWGFAAASISS